jgi:hypothetical protein
MWKQGSVFFSMDAFSLAGAKTLLSRFPVMSLLLYYWRLCWFNERIYTPCNF